MTDTLPSNAGRKRVVVTGFGAVSPLGNTAENSWKAACEGQSGIVPITSFDASEYPVRFAGEVRDFDVSDYMEPKKARIFDPFIHFGIAAALQAREHAGLDKFAGLNNDRVGTFIGSGIGGIQSIEENLNASFKGGHRKVSPFFIPGSIINMISGQLSIMTGARGPNLAVVTACTTGTHSIGMAARLIAYGDADVMYAGGAEKSIAPSPMAGFGRAKALSKRNDDPASSSRPWDIGRDGFVMADGGAVMILESLEHAEARGATIYAEVLGFGMSGDAHHITAPIESGEGASRCMQAALNDAGIQANEVNYLNAHATSTPLGDVAEVAAIKCTFGDHAHDLLVSGTKSMTGHMLGAAGAMEAVFSVQAMRDSIVPPTINLDQPSEGCDLDFVPNVARHKPLEVVMSNSFGFGGTNGTLIFGRPD